MPNNHPVKKRPEWCALQSHYDDIKTQHMKDMFDNDAGRFDEFHIKLGDIVFDYSKHRITKETLKLFTALGQAKKIKDHYRDIMAGAPVNKSENRAVLHMALRSPVSDDVVIDGENVNAFVKDMHALIKKVSDKIRSNKNITDVIHIGVGGSHLAPKLACTALAAQHSGPNMHFLSSLDGQTINSLLAKLNPQSTIFIIASKTFTTSETMTNAKLAKEWLGNDENLYAITATTEKAEAFGVNRDKILPMRRWIGGRFSVWSSIGLPIAIACGYETFETFLEGASEADNHVLTADLDRNIPFLMAMLGVWYRNFFDYRSQSILPYSNALSLLPSYIQQIAMESNGKAAQNIKTSPIIIGGTGTESQHTFMQALHQGPDIVPCDFIVPVKNKNAESDIQKALVANALAQSQALMRGAENTPQPHRHFEGNRPSTTILIKELNPKTLGMLMALYEHQIIIQGHIWNINSFDQWGVELGKELAKDITADLHAKTTSDTHDSSTAGLIHAILKD